MDGNKLSFEVDVDVDGQKIRAQATATIDGDEMTIISEYAGDYDSGTSTAKAKRSVRAADVVGQWKLRFDTPDGYRKEPTLTLTREKKKLRATFTDTDGESFPVTRVQLKGNLLST